MRRIGLAMLLLAGACSRDPGPAVLAAETRWMAAMQARDAAALEALVAPGFTLAGVTPSGRPPVPRAAWIDNALRHLTLTEVRVRQARASVEGDTVTVRATLTWAGAYDGEAFRETVPVVDVWRPAGGAGWQVISRRVGEPLAP